MIVSPPGSCRIFSVESKSRSRSCFCRCVFLLWPILLDLNFSVRVFKDTYFCQIIWQILSYTEQNKFHQKLSLVGFETQDFLIITLILYPELGSNWAEDFWSKLCFMHHFIFWTWFISIINKAWLYKDIDASFTLCIFSDCDCDFSYHNKWVVQDSMEVFTLWHHQPLCRPLLHKKLHSQ